MIKPSPLRGRRRPSRNAPAANRLKSIKASPLLHFAQRKIQQKLSASFRGFPFLIFAQRKNSKKWEAFPFVKASPRGAFLAELPPKGNLGGLLSAKRTDEGRSPFLIEIFLQNFSIKGRNLFSDSYSHPIAFLKGYTPSRFEKRQPQ